MIPRNTVTPLRLHAPLAIEILDQTRLPHEERYLRLTDVADLCEAIRSLRVRGAPLLGLAGASGLALAASTRGAGDASLTEAAAELTATRPTAVDLGALVAEALGLALKEPEAERAALLWEFAASARRRREESDTALSRLGAALLPPGASVLTHCNAGGLATGATGTALGVVFEAHRQGRLERCYATETRPLLQGARLTAWELVRGGVPATLLPDTAAAALIASGALSAVITGADRVAANGDSANKIGTYGLAAVAARHSVPFYIAAPWTTVDLQCPDGRAIPIEFRSADEVGGFAGQRWAPDGISAYNPAFDVTPADLITAIITDLGVVRPPYSDSLAALSPSR